MKEDNLARRPIWAREIASSTLAFHINMSKNILNFTVVNTLIAYA